MSKAEGLDVVHADTDPDWPLVVVFPAPGSIPAKMRTPLQGGLVWPVMAHGSSQQLAARRLLDQASPERGPSLRRWLDDHVHVLDRMPGSLS